MKTEKMLDERLFAKDLEQKLSEIHEAAAEARNAGNAVLSKLSALRSWITEQEIKRLKDQSGRIGGEG